MKKIFTNNQPQPPIMRGKPVPQEWRVNLENWDSPPYNRWAFSHCNEIMPSAIIARDEKNALFFPKKLQDLSTVPFTDNQGQAMTLEAYLSNGFTDAYVVYHKGAIVFEKYFAFTTATSRHLMQSMSKSLVGAVAQKLKAEKILRGDMLVEDILPEMKKTGYAGATMQQAMDMRTGIDFKETYFENPLQGDCFDLDVASGWKPNPGNIASDNFSLLQTYKKQIFAHGHDMIYRCVETDVVTHCIEKLTGKKIAELVSEFFWRPMGAEGDAFFTVDSHGYGIGSGGACARAVDMLKFGVMMAEGGVINGKQLLPESLVAECYNPAPYQFDKKHPELTPCGGYKNFFWINDQSPQVILCSGVFGQLVYIDKTNDVVITAFSSWPTHGTDNGWVDSLLASEAIVNALS
ncbi:MAG: serine hydrolase [Hydrotalea sp.]|nr:serine hydrolase [Hydrotalea sp.]